MAPEQALCEVGQDHRVDIWAIGAIAYELLSGRRPVEGVNAAQIFKGLLSDAVTPLHVLVPELPGVVNWTVMQMLERVQTERPSLEEVLTRLRPFLGIAQALEAGAPRVKPSLPAPARSPSLSERPSSEVPASYSTVRPSLGAGSTPQSSLPTAPPRVWQRGWTVAAACGVLIAGGLLLGPRREPSISSAASLVSEPGRLVPTATTATPDTATRTAVTPVSATLPSVAIASPVQSAVAHTRQIARSLRTIPAAQRAEPDEKPPRPIDRRNPFTGAE
jgi:serine/threonine-protein kinase